MNRPADRPETWDDERLLEWILDPEARDDAARSELEADVVAGARLRELEQFLATCRHALADEVQEGESDGSALARRVLARTTREDLSWRGDLALVGGFVRDRLRSSVLLRLAAASLVFHLAGLSVLAYHLMTQVQEPHFNTGIELLAEPEFLDREDEPLGELSVPEVRDDPEVREIAPPDTETGDGESGDDR